MLFKIWPLPSFHWCIFSLTPKYFLFSFAKYYCGSSGLTDTGWHDSVRDPAAGKEGAAEACSDPTHTNAPQKINIKYEVKIYGRYKYRMLLHCFCAIFKVKVSKHRDVLYNTSPDFNRWDSGGGCNKKLNFLIDCIPEFFRLIL